jgi:hypothetical protein
VRLAVSVSLLACTSPRKGKTPEPVDEPCTVLPAVLPSGAAIEYQHNDSEQDNVHHVGFVADADCPAPDPRLGLEKPECVRLTQEELQTMWTTLQGYELHRVAMFDRGGTCHHCGTRWITITWPDGYCSRGSSFFTEINDGRFYLATQYLDYVAEHLLAPGDELEQEQME